MRHTCSMTSGAIQHGVPTNVCLERSRARFPPDAIKELTPKSANMTVPSFPRRILPALMSLKIIIFLQCIDVGAL